MRVMSVSKSIWAGVMVAAVASLALGPGIAKADPTFRAKSGETFKREKGKDWNLVYTNGNVTRMKEFPAPNASYTWLKSASGEYQAALYNDYYIWKAPGKPWSKPIPGEFVP